MRHRLTLAAAAIASTLAFAAQAEDMRGAAVLPKYRTECSGCHVAYPPGLLPAASWNRIMTNLPKHFGTDASLDAATTRELSAWLASQAGASRRVREEPREDRITRSSWFTREHGEVTAKTWKSPAVKSAANCAACHTRADQGDFDEHTVRIPR